MEWSSKWYGLPRDLHLCFQVSCGNGHWTQCHATALAVAFEVGSGWDGFVLFATVNHHFWKTSWICLFFFGDSLRIGILMGWIFHHQISPFSGISWDVSCQLRRFKVGIIPIPSMGLPYLPYIYHKKLTIHGSENVQSSLLVVNCILGVEASLLDSLVFTQATGCGYEWWVHHTLHWSVELVARFCFNRWSLSKIMWMCCHQGILPGSGTGW